MTQRFAAEISSFRERICEMLTGTRLVDTISVKGNQITVITTSPVLHGPRVLSAFPPETDLCKLPKVARLITRRLFDQPGVTLLNLDAEKIVVTIDPLFVHVLDVDPYQWTVQQIINGGHYQPIRAPKSPVYLGIRYLGTADRLVLHILEPLTRTQCFPVHLDRTNTYLPNYLTRLGIAIYSVLQPVPAHTKIFIHPYHLSVHVDAWGNTLTNTMDFIMSLVKQVMKLELHTRAIKEIFLREDSDGSPIGKPTCEGDYSRVPELPGN